MSEEKNSQLWQQHQGTPFPPGYGGEEVEGVDLVLIDTYASGCISSAIGNRRPLDIERARILKECIIDMEKVLPKLKGDAHEYFFDLHALATSVHEKYVR
jgi:hypothetical protein